MRWTGLLAGWRANAAAASTLGAMLGMLPGAFLMATLRDPLPTLVVGPLLLLSGAVFSGLLAGWTANLSTQRRGRSLFAPILTVAVSTGTMVAIGWVALVATGTWDVVFPFPPFFGLIGMGLFVAAATALATGVFWEDFEWDALDVATTFVWAGLPPALLVGALRGVCTLGACG